MQVDLLRPLAGIGVLVLFISAFLPWLDKSSLFFGAGNEAALDISIFSLVVLLFLGGFLGGLLALGRQRRWYPIYPGLLSVLSGGFWLYELSNSGRLTSTLAVSGVIFGPYLAILGGICLLVSSFVSREDGTGVARYSGRDRGGRDFARERRFSLGRPRVRWGPWVLLGLWFVATIAVYQLFVPPDSAAWYVVDLLGVSAGLWLGYGYFKWVGRSAYSSGRLFLVTIGSFVLFPIIGGFPLGLYPASPCSLFPNLVSGCQGTSYSQTFTNFYAPTYVAGLINSVTSLTAPLALLILLGALYGAYRLAHTVFVR